MATLLDIEVI